MPDHHLIAAVVKAVQEAAPTAPPPVDHDRSLLEQGLDSLDHSAVLLALEETYGVDIPDEDVERLKSVNAIAAYLASRVRG
jgi:acyl carrier protein